ncbi:hypothetical protein B0H13DRAFT_263333 [Mycena leptocephala]|nr:hypothetical protein B0H13DRAFT_263333 [Mycena leptocephala]
MPVSPFPFNPHHSTDRPLFAVADSTRVPAPIVPSLEALIASKRISSRADCLSGFLRALCERYRPPPHAFVDEAEEASTEDPPAFPVDWSPPPLPLKCEPLERLPKEKPFKSLSKKLRADPGKLQKAIYNPHGKWAWTTGFTFRESGPSVLLSSGVMCSAFLKTGHIGHQPVKYVSKMWLTKEKWHGFFSELALYKKQLKPLQGRVVPAIINVYSCAGAVDVAMEPPHHSFWIEASADMPYVLKKRCVEAFEKLHAAGVHHGDIELRHMLIGGDARVTIIDFQASRALEPNAAVKLEAATPDELRLEMRKVKFKLDYDGARVREDAKLMRAARLARRNQRRGKLEEPLPEDVRDPPIDSRQWNLEWIGASVEPARFVMPGQTAADLEREVEEFLDILEKLEEEETRRDGAVKRQREASPDFKPPAVVPAKPTGRQSLGKDLGPTVEAPARATRQRIASTDLKPPTIVPTKPPGKGFGETVATQTPRPLKRKGDCDRPQQDHKRIRIDACALPRSPPPVKARDFALEAPTPSTSRPLPAIIARDFAYETPRSSAPPRQPEPKPLDAPPRQQPPAPKPTLDTPTPPSSSPAKRKRTTDPCDESLETTRGRPKMRTSFACDVSSEPSPAPKCATVSMVMLDAVPQSKAATAHSVLQPKAQDAPLLVRWIGEMWRFVSA